MKDTRSEHEALVTEALRIALQKEQLTDGRETTFALALGIAVVYALMAIVAAIREVKQ